ncbi:MAG: hypothetical protein H6721_18760 [Sandaracinus sp.]|nr:hypothetical protein [Sandaracinus sp.]
MSWRVVSFDRALARGTIRSDLGTLPFDASVALVDDFFVGEEVEVSLRPEAGHPVGYVVTRVVPLAFRPPFAVPALEELTRQLEVGKLIGYRAWVAMSDEDEVRLRVDDDSYCPTRTLVFRGARMFQGPLELESLGALQAFRASDVAESLPELVRHWPTLPERCVVFRIDPVEFGAAAIYVAAARVDLVVG